MEIKEKLEYIYNQHKKMYDNEASKLEYAASETFGLATYDGELDELFVTKIIEVLKVIINKKNFEYIENKENYINYIIVCQLLDRMNWINWGTSIRGAWLEDFDDERPQENIASYWGEYYNGEKWIVTDLKVPYSKENVIALIEWIEEK